MQARWGEHEHGGNARGGGGGVEEEMMMVLPPHTKVVVTGNNRTKSVLVGLRGVVKKAVGLGGWHWLVLTNGIEVKLQRNALSVIEGPPGDEHELIERDDMQWSRSGLASEDAYQHKSHRPRSRQQRASQYRSLSRSLSGDSQSKGSVTSSSRAKMKVDLSKLQTTALWRYWHHFNLDASPNPSKEQLVDAVERHFMSQQLDELQVIKGFLQATKRLKTKVQFAQ